MKKLTSLAFSLIATLLLVTACKNATSNTTDPEKKNTNGKANVKTAGKKDILSFNLGNLNALAITSSEDNRAASGRSASTEGMIVKIMEDGSIQDFINVPSNIELAPVNYIAQSPAPDAKEIYIVFNYQTYWSEQVPNEYGGYNWEQHTLGQLICVTEDGKFYDILEQEDNSYKWLYNAAEDSIAFDQNGGMYYLVSENSGNNHTNMIYKFNPADGTSTPLTPAVTNTYYNKMQISKDGNWIFAQANRWTGNSDTRYLRAIPTADPENFANLFYTSNSGSWINDWYYDDDTQMIYYIQDSVLYGVPLKDGVFSKDNRIEFFGSNSGSNSTFYYDALISSQSGDIKTWNGRSFSSDIVDSSNANGKYYYFISPENEEEIQTQEILDYLFAEAYSSFDPEKISWTTWLNNYQNYEIKFEKFASVEGFEQLASLTEGKSNLELIEAIIDNNLEELLYSLIVEISTSGRYKGSSNFDNFYNNNFFADVLYEKETGDSISTDLFRTTKYQNTTKFATNGVNYLSLLKSVWSNNYDWKEAFKNTDGSVNAAKVLKELASYCGKTEIDFSLKSFKDNAKYGLLYTDLTNEEAIEFLDSPAKLSKLYEYLCDYNNYDSYNGYGKFLLETCFVKDTNFVTKAYKWRESYNDSIWWGSVTKLTPSYKSSLYGVYNGNSSNGLIKILDEDGNRIGNYVEALNDYKVVDLISSDTGFYFKSALLDANKEETGNHHICYYDVEKDVCTNLFDKVEKKDETEVISFSVGDNSVYYCAAQGFTIINAKIDVTTKDVTILNSNTKLTQIIVIK